MKSCPVDPCSDWCSAAQCSADTPAVGSSPFPQSAECDTLSSLCQSPRCLLATGCNTDMVCYFSREQILRVYRVMHGGPEVSKSKINVKKKLFSDLIFFYLKTDLKI